MIVSWSCCSGCSMTPKHKHMACLLSVAGLSQPRHGKAHACGVTNLPWSAAGTVQHWLLLALGPSSGQPTLHAQVHWPSPTQRGCFCTHQLQDWCAGSMIMLNNGEVVASAPDDASQSAATTDVVGITADSLSEGSPSSERRWHAAAR